MRIIKTNEKKESPEIRKRIAAFFSKYGKRTAAAAAGVLIVGTAVALNFILPKTADGAGKQPAGVAGADVKYEDFYAASALNRTKARDEAMEVLHTVVDAGKDGEASKQALADISRISSDIEKEANIETLIKAKGFEDCIAVISGKSLSIVVKSDKLLPSEIAQIKEIAYKSADVLPDDVVITLKR